MANEDKKDFNAMLHDSKDMPKFQIITDQKSIEKYGGSRMYFAPPIEYDKVMKLIPYGKVITVGKIREYFAKLNGADFTEPITAGIFVSIAAWASYQRSEDETPYWRTLKANGELNAKYPGGVEAQKEKLEAEGHTIIQKGRTNIGNVDTYTITYTDGTTSTFTVTNGKDGVSPTITIGENGHWFVNDVDTGKNAVVKESKVIVITVIAVTALAVSLATLAYVVSKNRKLMDALLNK